MEKVNLPTHYCLLHVIKVLILILNLTNNWMRIFFPPIYCSFHFLLCTFLLLVIKQEWTGIGFTIGNSSIFLLLERTNTESKLVFRKSIRFGNKVVRVTHL